MDAAPDDDTTAIPAVTGTDTDAQIVVPTEPVDAIARLLAGAALALAAVGLLELLGTVTVGLAVKVSRLNFGARQGYAFLNDLEKSPVGLMLVIAALAAAIATLRPRPDGRTAQLSTIALWVVIVGAVILGVGTVLGVLARFRLADLAASQRVDPVTRRALVVFVIRNFGTAITALLVAVGAVFNVRPPRPDVA